MKTYPDLIAFRCAWRGGLGASLAPVAYALFGLAKQHDPFVLADVAVPLLIVGGVGFSVGALIGFILGLSYGDGKRLSLALRLLVGLGLSGCSLSVVLVFLVAFLPRGLPMLLPRESFLQGVSLVLFFFGVIPAMVAAPWRSKVVQ